jgi:hypothetical protein
MWHRTNIRTPIEVVTNALRKSRSLDLMKNVTSLFMSVTHNCITYLVQSVLIRRCNKLTQEDTLEKWRAVDGAWKHKF